MQKRVLALVLFLTILVVGCASTNDQNALVDDSGLSDIVEASAAQSNVGASSGYFEELASHWNRKQLAGKGKCYAISPASILYLQIEAGGTVSRVYGSPENRRSKCYRAAYTNLTLPKPPVSPFYFKLDIQ